MATRHGTLNRLLLLPTYMAKGLYSLLAPIVWSCRLFKGQPLVVKHFQLPLLRSGTEFVLSNKPELVQTSFETVKCFSVVSILVVLAVT